jgi:hypothetical protein
VLRQNEKGPLLLRAALFPLQEFFSAKCAPLSGAPKNYPRLINGLVDWSFLDFFRVFFAIFFLPLNCPSGAMLSYMQSVRHSPHSSLIPVSVLESASRPNRSFFCILQGALPY